MMKHDYCFAFCNRSTRRTCKSECDKWTVDDPIEQSLLDIKCRFKLLGEMPVGGNRSLAPLYHSAAIDDIEMSKRGRDCWMMWLAALGVEHLTYKTFDDLIEQVEDQRELAVENGLGYMLEAYHEGVPVEDIVA